MGVFIYYLGRAGQLLGMVLLIEDIAFAGPMGPDAKTFGVGVVAFLAGWGLVRVAGTKS